MLRVLADTNIALDLAMRRNGWWEYAHEIFEASAQGKIQVTFAATSLKDLYFITRKQSSENEATGYIDFIMSICHIGEVTGATCRLAREENEPDFEDGIVAAVAREQAVDIIISRDKDAFNNACAPKINSKQFVDFFLRANSEALFFEQNGDEVRQLG